MTLEEFCSLYGLSDKIRERLADAEVSGPHSLETYDKAAYMAPESSNGLGMRPGAAGDLVIAMEAWWKGLRKDGRAIACVEEDTGEQLRE
jgi:hypothetical protein